MNSEKECYSVVSLLGDSETVGGHAAEVGAHLVAKEAVISSVGGAFAGLQGVFSIVGVGVASAASIMINQADYQSKRAALRKMYKDEVGAQLGISSSKVKDRDIELVAKGDPKNGIAGNKTIADELHKLTKRRNVGMLVTVVSLLATVAVIATLVTPAITAATVGATLTAGALITKLIAGFTIHKILENPIKKLSKKIFHLNEVTTHERISELNKEHRNGKVLTRAQVLGVFVSANKELGQFVTEQYERPYDRLSVQEKQLVVEAMEQHIPLTNITKNLNSGTVKISELAFAAEGKISGVEPNSVKQPLSLVGKARNTLRGVGDRLQHVKRRNNDLVAASAIPQVATPQRANLEYDNPAATSSFVERYEAEKISNISRTLH
jgi:hypothetical protein